MCSVKNCTKPILARGFCSAHYNKWRKYGDPLHARMIARGSHAAWLADAAKTHSDDCLLWPFKSLQTSGYSLVMRKGRPSSGHRIVCEAVNGPSPSPMHQAAHSCGNKLCCNPRHIRWATQSENEADKIGHGTHVKGERNPMAKLDTGKVAKIREAISLGMSQQSVADQFKVSRRCIGMIANNSTWKEAA